MESNWQRGYKMLRYFTDDRYHNISVDKTYQIYQNLPRPPLNIRQFKTRAREIPQVFLQFEMKQRREFAKITPRNGKNNKAHNKYKHRC